MKLDRLIGILTILLQNNRVTAPYLAERFEVTRRTIGRDIDALCQAGIPIVTQQGGNGGISIAEGYKLDKSVLTSDELSGIVAALKAIGSISEKSHIERTLDKLVGTSVQTRTSFGLQDVSARRATGLSASKDVVVSLREPIVIDLASHYKGSLTEKIELIKKAIYNQHLIEFDYYYEKGMTHRRIEPCFIIFQWTSWYIFGYCPEREDFRMFKLQRLWDLCICDVSFIPREIPPEKRDFNARFPDDKKLVALFDPSVQYQLIETYGLNCYTETEEGKLRLEIGYTNRDYTISWLLGFGNRAKVIEPLDMAKEIRAIAKNIFESYE